MKSIPLVALAALSLLSRPILAYAAVGAWYVGAEIGGAVARASQNQANNVSDTLDTSLAASGNSVSSATLASRSAFSGSLFGGYRVAGTSRPRSPISISAA
jgi:hypothetical protein